MVNTNFGPVLFTQENIDLESGLTQGTVIEIYSTIVEEGVYNLLHMHMDDTSQTVVLSFIPSLGGD